MEFLDLSGASERERNEIDEILRRGSHGVEFPVEFSEPNVICNDVVNDSNEQLLENKTVEENISAHDVTLMTSAHPSLTTFMPAFLGNQGQATVANAVFDSKRQPIIPQDSFKGHYYPTAFGHQMQITSKRDANAMMTPESIKVPFYSSPPHFGPVLTSISHVSPPIGTTSNMQGALSPTGIAVVTSAANSVGDENENRVTVTGNGYPMTAAFPHPYAGNHYLPSHGAPLPIPPHMYPLYFPVQLTPPFYAPMPTAMAQSHTIRHPTVSRTMNYPQNGNIVGQMSGDMNGGISSGDETTVDNKACDVKGVEDKCEPITSKEDVCGNFDNDAQIETNSVDNVSDERNKEDTSSGEIPSDPIDSSDNLTVVGEENCSVNVCKKNEETPFGDLCDKVSESTAVSLSSNKDTIANTSGTRSWADLFKGQYSSTSSLHNAAYTEPLSITEHSHSPNITGETRIDTDSQNVLSGNCTSLDAQSNDISLQEDPLAKKLARKLKEIHLKHSLPFLIPRGFVNRGNWCYINATLQALLYCPPFYNLMREIGEIPGIFREKSSTPVIDSFAKFFSNFLPSESMMKKGKLGPGFNAEDLPTGEPFEPKCIYDVLGAIKSECLKGKQEDAEEFLSSLLNGLHDEMVLLFNYLEKSEKKNNSIANTNGHLNDEESCDDRIVNNDDDSSLWKEVGPKHKALPMRSAKVIETPILNIFGGSILSVRTAGKDMCGNRQPFFTLQLDIQSEKIKSVEDALRVLTSSESIQGYTCPKTKQTVEASNQTFLDQLPPILILHLKLFGYDKDGGSRKLLKKIDYPIDLELPRDCIHQDRSGDKNKYSKSYKLLAVVHHDGNESVKGHYVTDIFHIGSSLWLRCDDSSIKVISTQQLMNPQLPRVPYLLFYRRCDTLRGQNQPQRTITSH